MASSLAIRAAVGASRVACDLGDYGAASVAALLAEARRRFPGLIELYDNTASLQNRTVTTPSGLRSMRTRSSS